MRRATTKASTNTLLYHGSGGQCFGPHPAAARQFIWDLWWTKRHWGGLFFESIIIPTVLLVLLTYKQLQATVHNYVFSLNYQNKDIYI
jgi:hypothetical protein